MGRRKIEIKPIRDDRNRSVTFLKRKGGLFKKAHELSVLCSVDVAVIIFGHNKKLYEYSSSDISEIIGRFQYYGGAHEHKGPADFADRGGGDDDDDDGDDGGDVDDRNTPVPEHHVMHTHMQNHPGFHHLRHGTPTASPPMPSGAMPQFTRGPSPIPPGMSRPSSRASSRAGHLRRTSANYQGPHGHPGHGTPPQPSYAYSPNPPFYNPPPPTASQVPGRAPQHSHQPSYPPPPFNPMSQPPPAPPQMAHRAYVQDDRGASMPPAFPPPPPPPPPPQANMSRNSSNEHLQPPPLPPPSQRSPRLTHQRPTPSPQPPQQEFASPPLPQPKPLPAHAKSHSIFTPIDDSRSMLAQHWGPSGASLDSNKAEGAIKVEDGGPRPQSVDLGAVQRGKTASSSGTGVAPSLPPPSAPSPPPPEARSSSTSKMSAAHAPPPPRPSTTPSDAKRPRLKVQIPSEQSGDEAATGESGAEEPSTSRPLQQPQHGVVLPPPSPSASALLSAGAQGPPNPFARPAPPMSTNPHAMPRDSNHIETPISALPSRFMSDNLLPSPSTFYPEWGFGRSGDPNMLPSPLNFQTPVAPHSTGWRDEERKRPNEEEPAGSEAKRSKN